MSKFIRIILGAVGTLVALWLLTAIYFVVAPGIIGPKAEVQNFCSAIEPGTTTADLETISGDHGAFPIFGSLDDGTVQVDLQLKNGWVCMCQVETEDGKVVQPNDVFCSD